MASNAPLATNGHASNPSRNFATNTALLFPVQMRIKPAVPAKPAMENIITVLAVMVTLGAIRPKNVNTTTRPTASSEHCTCSNDYISSKKLLGIVIYEKSASQNGWVMTHKPIATYIIWGEDRVDIPGLTNITSESSLTDIQASCTNTDIITAYGNSSKYPAAWAAKNYKEGGKTWCLLSGGLLKNTLDNSANLTRFNAAIYKIQASAGTSAATILGNAYNGYELIWSSSESSSSYAWTFGIYTTGSFSMYQSHKDSRIYSISVRPVMAF